MTLFLTSASRAESLPQQARREEGAKREEMIYWTKAAAAAGPFVFLATYFVVLLSRLGLGLVAHVVQFSCSRPARMGWRRGCLNPHSTVVQLLLNGE